MADDNTASLNSNKIDLFDLIDFDNNNDFFLDEKKVASACAPPKEYLDEDIQNLNNFDVYHIFNISIFILNIFYNDDMGFRKPSAHSFIKNKMNLLRSSFPHNEVEDYISARKSFLIDNTPQSMILKQKDSNSFG